MALMSYLLRDKHGTYYFRRVIPVDLRRFMPAPWTGKANQRLASRETRTKTELDLLLIERLPYVFFIS